MQAEGSRWKLQDGMSGANLRNTAYCSKRKASDESAASKEGKMAKKKFLSGTPSASNASVNVEEWWVETSRRVISFIGESGARETLLGSW
jgi:hypothetical protein